MQSSTALLPVALGSQTVSAGRESGRTLDVPFVAQDINLCGGAAVAMVLRYWGTRGVYAEDFAGYLQPDRRGITTGDLARAVRDRGWTAVPFAGETAEIRTQVARGHPVIALIENRPGNYHFVVVVGWSSNRIIVHDPALQAFRSFDDSDWEAAWTRGRRWAMLVLPGSRPLSSPDLAIQADEPARSGNGICDPVVARGVALAALGDLPAAEATLDSARVQCPWEASAVREQAGIRFHEERWDSAATLAQRALAVEPGDRYTLELMAASRYLAGDEMGALDAWNVMGAPRLDLAEVRGVTHTRTRVVLDRLGLEHGAPLTSADLSRAHRRLIELPSVGLAGLRYHPVSREEVTVQAAVVERADTWRSPVTLAATALEALTTGEATIRAVSPTGGGEMFTVSGRWAEHRPAVAVTAAAPDAFGLPGILEIAGQWQRESYQAVPESGVVAETRREARVSWSDWVSGGVRWLGSVGLDRFSAHSYLPAGVELEIQVFDQRLVFLGHGRHWVPLSGGPGFTQAGLLTSWRSGRQRLGWVGAGRVGIEALFGSQAPLATWPGVGTGLARGILLRAHPLLQDGVINLAGLSRTIVHGGGEARYWTRIGGALPLSVVGFVDAAHLLPASETGAASRWHADVGVGVGLPIPGGYHGDMLQLEIARGLADGNTAVTLGWRMGWTGRSRRPYL